MPHRFPLSSDQQFDTNKNSARFTCSSTIVLHCFIQLYCTIFSQCRTKWCKFRDIVKISIPYGNNIISSPTLTFIGYLAMVSRLVSANNYFIFVHRVATEEINSCPIKQIRGASLVTSAFMQQEYSLNSVINKIYVGCSLFIRFQLLKIMHKSFVHTAS